MLVEARCNLRCNLMSYTMPSKQQGKVKTAAEVDKHIRRRTNLWSHIINHRYKPACGSSLLSLTIQRTNPTRPSLERVRKRESHHLLPRWCFSSFTLPQWRLGTEWGEPLGAAGWLATHWPAFVRGCSERSGWDPCGRSLVWLEAVVSCLCHTLWNPSLSTYVIVGCRNSSLCALAQIAFLNNFTALATRTANSLVGAQACVCSSKVRAKKWQQR